MSATIGYPCGCSFTRDMFSHLNTHVLTCSRHRKHPRVQQALDALRSAVSEAHNDVSPMEVAQEERKKYDERYG